MSVYNIKFVCLFVELFVDKEFYVVCKICIVNLDIYLKFLLEII